LLPGGNGTTIRQHSNTHKITQLKKNKSATNYINNGAHIAANEYNVEKINKAIFVTGFEGLFGCETSRLPHRLDRQFIVGG
jgi:hypothetical protein